MLGAFLIIASLVACQAPPISQEEQERRTTEALAFFEKEQELERLRIERMHAMLYVRNNNPFNIRVNRKNRWRGKIPTDEPFERFASLDYGIRAGIKLLRNYQDYYGLRTLEQIIYKFAPPFENNTIGYIDKVSEQTGIEKDKPIDLYEKDTLLAICQYMIEVEMGKPIARKRIEQVYNKFFI